jgi:hypothetical protein
MDNIQIAINVLNSHDMLEEAEKLKSIANVCNCIECKEYREPHNKQINSARATGLPKELKKFISGYPDHNYTP